MATEYQFLGTNVDVTFFTDAPVNAKSFFITGSTGYDSIEIVNGIDFEIQEYHEADLMQMAMDRSVALYRRNRLGTACLVLPGVAAGSFNGISSFLSVPGIDYTDGSGEIANDITTRVTFRVSEQDVANLPEEFYLVSSSNGGNIHAIRFLRIIPDATNQFFTANIFPELNGSNFGAGVNKSGIAITVNINMCYTIEFQNIRSGTNLIWVISINGQEQRFETELVNVSATTPTTVYFGATGGENMIDGFFRGIMRNLSVSIGGTEVINIIDPSTGTNTGTGADGAPTDITAVTVIV